jgi:hypothetical protein
MAYDASTPGRPMACSHMQGRRVPTSCPSTLYAALAHSLLGSVPLTYGDLPLRWFSSVLTIATIGELAPLKIHR